MSASAPAEAGHADAAVTVPRLVRFAVDSDELGSLFACDFVRTYADLIPDTHALMELQARFPDSVIELIDRGLGDPTGTANLLDVEPGALTPQQAAEKIRADQAAGKRWQTVYSDRNDLAAVEQACHGLDYYHWIGAFGAMVVPGYTSSQIQFADAPMLGVHADLSVIWDPTYRPSPARISDRTVALLATDTPLATAAAAAAAAAQTALSENNLRTQLRDILTGSKEHHGDLSLLERDLAAVPDMVIHHANLLAALARLVA